MITFVQQILASGFLLLYGVLALQVWRRAGPVRHDRATLAWGVTAAYFMLTGILSTGQSVLACIGWSMGLKSPLLLWVGTWSVPANLARAALGVVFALILLALLVTRRRWALRAAHLAPVLLTAGLIVLTAVGLQIPALEGNFYWLGTGGAVLSTITAVILMGALLAAVLNDGIDQLLWLSLALYTLKETVSVSLFTLIAWWSVIRAPQAWYFFYWVAIALGMGMSLLAVRRLRLAGAGERVPALFERMYTLRSPLT